MKLTLLITVLLSVLAWPASTAVIHVPGDQPTIQAGLDAAVTGDTILVADGTWTGAGNANFGISEEGITLRSENGPLACIIDCEYVVGNWIGFSDDGRQSTLDGFTITHANGGSAVICAPYADGLQITNCHIVSNGLDWNFGAGGITCSTDSSVEITDCLIAGNVGYLGGGVHCWDADVTLTNCLLYWNYSTDDFSWPYEGGAGAGIYGEQYANITVANCTITGNSGGSTGFGGGIGLVEDCTVTVTNSIIWDNAPDQIGLANGSTATVTYSDVWGGYAGTGNINQIPWFTNGPEGTYFLSQVAAGQGLDSPCLDAGSGPAAAICFSTPAGTACMNQRSTRSDSFGDTDTVDMGCHFTKLNTVSASFTCTPTSGTVPFPTQMSAQMDNNYTGFSRRMTGRINITLASGQSISNWRSGNTVIAAGGSFSTSWNTTIPALARVIGDNRFQLVAVDVTPAPYNQPPYPTAGDSATDSCTVTGVAP